MTRRSIAHASPNLLLISQLRPGQDIGALRQALGGAWQEIERKSTGYCWGSRIGIDFVARVDVDGVIGSLSFYGKFPSKYVVEGLYLGMPQDEGLAACSGLTPDSKDDSADGSIRGFRGRVPGGLELDLRFRDGRLIGMDWSVPRCVYPRADVWTPAPEGKYPLPEQQRGSPFKDANLKLAVLDALCRQGLIDLGDAEDLAMHVMGRYVDLENEGWELLPDVYDYLLRYPLETELLARVDTLSFDGGLNIYTYIWPHWGGESDAFDIHSIDNIGHCAGLRTFAEIALTSGLDLLPLSHLQQLREVELAPGAHRNGQILLQLPHLQRLTCFDNSFVEMNITTQLEANGVRVKIYS
jgi:hypothetical protein